MKWLERSVRHLPQTLVVVAIVLSGVCGCAESREMKGCFVARFERFEFRDAADGTTYFVVAADDEVTRRLRGFVGNSTLAVVPVAIKGMAKSVAGGVGPNARYQATIKVSDVSELEDQQLCAVGKE